MSKKKRIPRRKREKRPKKHLFIHSQKIKPIPENNNQKEETEKSSISTINNEDNVLLKRDLRLFLILSTLFFLIIMTIFIFLSINNLKIFGISY